MGILSSLTKFIPVVGPYVETGLNALSAVTGKASKAGAADLDKQNNLKLLLEQAKLNRDKFAVDAPGKRLSQSANASIMSNWQPTKVDWGPEGFKPGAGLAGNIPHFTGGASGGMANLDPETKALSKQVMHDNLMSQMRGGETAGGTGAGWSAMAGGKADGHGTDAMMPTMDKPSTGSKILGGVGLGSSILSALMKFKKPGVSASETDD